MARFLYAILLGLVGAGMVHICVVLLVPRFSDRDAWTALEAAGPPYRTLRLDGQADAPAIIPSIDPLFSAVGCRFDLSDGVVRVSGEGRVPYWSAAVHDRAGQNVFGFNDRTSTTGALDFVIATPVQMVELRNDLPAAFAASIFVEAELSEGIAVVRTFVPDATWEPQVAAYLDGVSCTRHAL